MGQVAALFTATLFRSRSWRIAAAFMALAGAQGSGFDNRGSQFIGFTRFCGFERSAGPAGECILTSPIVRSRIRWNELIASWDLNPRGAYLKVEVRALYPAHATKFYTLGIWCADPSLHPRQSVPDQMDEDGNISTDTLKLENPSEQLQIRLTLGDAPGRRADLRLLGICVTDTTASPGGLGPERRAWGRSIAVPERSQMAYPNGNVLCSPATVSMIMSYWAKALDRPELDRDVPEVADGVFDPNWRGTGNWPFNMAYPGSFRGLRAYVTRLSDVSELEAWIARGVPVGVSLCYNRLRGKKGPPSGHLVVCVGFTSDGDVVVNDPGTSRNIRNIFPRENLVDAWAYSRNTVYLIYPEGSEIPIDRFGHWDSWTAHVIMRTPRLGRSPKVELRSPKKGRIPEPEIDCLSDS